MHDSADQGRLRRRYFAARQPSPSTAVCVGMPGPVPLLIQYGFRVSQLAIDWIEMTPPSP